MTFGDRPRYASAFPALTCAALIGCGSASASNPPAAKVNVAAVDAIVARYVGRQTPGLSVAIGYRGRAIFEKAYGKSDLRSGALMTPRTHLEIGSMTKEMTSGALLTLARDKMLSIDDKVNVLLPPYKYGNRMTLRQLSTMSSGLQGALVNGDELFGIVGPGTHSTVAQIYKRLNAHPPSSPAGTKFDYANISYWLLGRTIEASTKMPYADAMQARIFRPLRMTTAYIRTPQTRDRKLATGYTRFGDGSFHRCPELDLRSSDAAGMGVMTASDVIGWDEAIRAQRLVQGQLAKDMFASSGASMGPGAPAGIGYAMGWFILKDGVRYHGGDTQLFASWNGMFPDGIDVVLLANAEQNQFALDRQTIAYKIHNAIAGLAPATVVKVSRAPSKVTSCPK
ncbi:MAG: serine hydrolase domain-containing protein [Candidatus Baltobacteraceae bacterium]